MTTGDETEHQSPTPLAPFETAEASIGVTRRLIRHFGTPSGATYGFQYFMVVLTLSFCGVAIYAGVRFVDGQRQSDCENTNDLRSRARVVATADVDADNTIWLAIDNLIPTGIPEPARTTVFSAIDRRHVLIDDTYQRTNCVTGELEPFTAWIT